MTPRWLLGAVLALVACDRAPPDRPASAAAPDPQIGTLYVQTCMACHTSPGSGAPQAGDRAAWEPRLREGMTVLLQRTVDGYKGMPPLGSCMDCTEAQFEGLIRFMAGGG